MLAAVYDGGGNSGSTYTHDFIELARRRYDGPADARFSTVSALVDVG